MQIRNVFLPRGLKAWDFFFFNLVITFYSIGHSSSTLPQMAFSRYGRTIVTDWSGFNWLIHVRADQILAAEQLIKLASC